MFISEDLNIISFETVIHVGLESTTVLVKLNLTDTFLKMQNCAKSVSFCTTVYVNAQCSN